MIPVYPGKNVCATCDKNIEKDTLFYIGGNEESKHNKCMCSNCYDNELSICYECYKPIKGGKFITMVTRDKLVYMCYKCYAPGRVNNE